MRRLVALAVLALVIVVPAGQAAAGHACTLRELMETLREAEAILGEAKEGGLSGSASVSFSGERHRRRSSISSMQARRSQRERIQANSDSSRALP